MLIELSYIYLFVDVDLKQNEPLSRTNSKKGPYKTRKDLASCPCK